MAGSCSHQVATDFRFHDGDGDQDLFFNLIKLPPEPQTVFTDCVIVFVASNLTFMFKTVRMPL